MLKRVVLVSCPFLFLASNFVAADCTEDQAKQNMQVWVNAINQHNLDSLKEFYPDHSIFIGPRSSKLLSTPAERSRYFNKLFADNHSTVHITIEHQDVVLYNQGSAIGHITFDAAWEKDGKKEESFERSVFIYSRSSSSAVCQLELQDVSSANKLYD